MEVIFVPILFLWPRDKLIIAQSRREKSSIRRDSGVKKKFINASLKKKFDKNIKRNFLSDDNDLIGLLNRTIHNISPPFF